MRQQFPRDKFWEDSDVPSLVKNPQGLKEFVGKEIGVTEWFEITQERIDRFAHATEDKQWIHVDDARARRESPFGTTIAHGFLTLSLISHLTRGAIQFESGIQRAVNYGLNRVRFPEAVRVGSRIRARVGLLACEIFPEGIAATYSVTVELENSSKPCCVAEWIVRYYC
jgi:acyl dehydratase